MMENLSPFIIPALLLVVIVIVLWLFVKVSRGGAGIGPGADSALRAELTDAMRANTEVMAARMNELTGHVTEQLSVISAQVQSHGGELNRRMDTASTLFSDLTRGLGELSKSSERIFEIGRDISGLHDILSAPKLRGGFGEFLLSDILAQCLPAKNFELQYGFRTGARVDAVIRLSGGIVPVDAKFPLENFRRLVAAEDEGASRAARKKFIADCVRHIDDIASSYILPEEGTLGFALMYVPAENVYYETMLKDGPLVDGMTFAEYAFSRRVVPVSPNSFYGYLQTVAMGLRGLEISERAEEMVRGLDALSREFAEMSSEMETLGRHIGNAGAKYDEVRRRTDRISDRLGGLAGRLGGPPKED